MLSSTQIISTPIRFCNKWFGAEFNSSAICLYPRRYSFVTSNLMLSSTTFTSSPIPLYNDWLFDAELNRVLYPRRYSFVMSNLMLSSTGFYTHADRVLS